MYTHTCGHDWPTALAHRVDSSPHHAARLRSSHPADESSRSPARCWLHQPEPKDPGAQVYLYVGVSENGVPSCTLLFSPIPGALQASIYMHKQRELPVKRVAAFGFQRDVDLRF